ncbi:MAG TPA: DUF4394 domain-containing protein [Blastocatellia bacterium]|nr:DUF4394 domain-containing protein [Blastocatellia bacterium]
MPRFPIYAIDTDNTIFVLVPGTTSFVRLVRIDNPGLDGNAIGCDFRPADGNNNNIYVVTDTGKIYTVSLLPATLGRATLVSSMTPGFPDGYQSLCDFNPVVNALRLIGSSTLNYAVVNGTAANPAASLGTTAVQTALTYNALDVNKGIAPRVSAGSYTNNFVGSTVTIFYGIDYNLDTFVTIDPAAAGGSSATGGGVLRTIGNLVTPTGARIKMSPTADFDIVTNRNGVNRLFGVSGRTLFGIDLGQATPSTALGSTRNVVVQGVTAIDLGGRLDDVAIPNPRYAAARSVLGGGNVVNTDPVGFRGPGFVNYADNVAGGYCEFQVNQNGTQTLVVRYSNGSTVNRPCNVTVNGVSVGTIQFPPTGSFSTFGLATLSVNLGAGGGFRALRITSTTPAGGPNMDDIEFDF